MMIMLQVEDLILNLIPAQRFPFLLELTFGENYDDSWDKVDEFKVNPVFLSPEQ